MYVSMCECVHVHSVYAGFNYPYAHNTSVHTYIVTADVFCTTVNSATLRKSAKLAPTHSRAIKCPTVASQWGYSGVTVV
jgi:hypothetical protein